MEDSRAVCIEGILVGTHMTFLTLEAWYQCTYVLTEDSHMSAFSSQIIDNHEHIPCNGEISRDFEFSQIWYESHLSHLLAI